MISWIKDNFGIKNFIVLTLVILVIVGFIKGPSWYKLIIKSQYEGVVEAKVANIVSKKALFQHFNGTNSKTVGYDVTYIYEVGNEKFSNTEFIEPNYDIKFILDQFNSGKTSVIEIKYSSEAPSKSFISKLNLGK